MYIGRQIELHDVDLKLNHRMDADELAKAGFDKIVLATGVTPRTLKTPGADSPKVRIMVIYIHLTTM